MVNSIYQNLKGKEYRVKEEHALKESHSPAFYSVLQEFEAIYEDIFSDRFYQAKNDMQEPSAGMQNLMESISLSENLFRVYLANGVILLYEEGIRRGLPREQAEDFKRESFLALAEAKGLPDLEAVGKQAAEDMNRRYRIHAFHGHNHLVHRAVELIQKERMNPISPSGIAGQLHCDRTYLAKRFREDLSMTLTEYITKVKMETAADLICTHAYSLAEVAELLSYSSYSHFQKKFKAYFQVTPAVYEQQLWAED